MRRARARRIRRSERGRGRLTPPLRDPSRAPVAQAAAGPGCTWPGRPGARERACSPPRSAARSPPRSDIHLASTSSASGSRSPSGGLGAIRETRRSTRSGARRYRCRRRRSAGADRAGIRSRRRSDAPDRDEPELRVHRVLLRGDDRAQELAGARSARRSRPGSYGGGASARRGRWAAGAAKARGQRRAEADQRQGGDHDRASWRRRALNRRRPAERTRRARPPCGISEKSRTMVASCRGPSDVGTAAHIPRSSWRRNSSTRRSSSSATSGSPSASSTSPWPGFMRTSFIAPDYASGLRAAERLPQRRRRRPGPGPAPSPRRPLPTASAAISRAHRAASTSSMPAREEGGERRRVRAARAVRGPVAGSAGRRFERPRRRRTARRRPSAVCPPVTITAVGPSAWIARASSSGSARSPSPASSRASGRFGVDHGGARQDALDQRRLGVRLEQHARRSRRPSRGRPRPARHRPGRAPRRPRRSSASSPSMPTLTASTPMSSATARTWATIISGGHRGDHLHPDRVLGGERRDRGRPVDAAARERLQVGLDAGAAAGVRAGDRQAGRYAAPALMRPA